MAPLATEERAFILLKFRRTAEAEPFARQAVGRAGAREQRLRLAFADGFLAAGDQARALMIVEGMGAGEAAARQRIAAGKTSGQAIDNLPKAFGEVLTAFAADLARLQRRRRRSAWSRSRATPTRRAAARRAARAAARRPGSRPTKRWRCFGRFRPTMR